MAELKNTFSWSFSAAAAFDECRRRRFWDKYGMWGGWDRNASEIQKKAYQLKQMDSIYSLYGHAVETAIMWVLRQKQNGKDVSVENAYQETAKPYLNKGWLESRDKKWRENPKKYCCLREHYYGEWDTDTQKQKTAAVIDRTKQCLANFISKVLPRIKTVKREQEVPITEGGRGDPENFEFNGVKIYAIPDYVYRIEDQVHIHDWKAGKAKEAHKQQLGLYGLWANMKHGVPAENIFVYIEYLLEGKVAPAQLSEGALEHTRNRITESAGDMADYLVDGNIERNEPVPKEEWDLATDQRSCRMCNFYELCKAELNGST